MKERLDYIDVAKGILIMLVVLHHIPHLAASVYDSVPKAYHIMQSSDIVYKAFFMPAFFMITGMFMKSDVTMKNFLVKNFKAILIPAFALGIIANWITLIANGNMSLIEYCKLGFSTFLLYGGPFWFLSALFISKILYFLMLKLKLRQGIQVIILLAGLLIGVSFNRCLNTDAYWHVNHGLVLCLFLFVGGGMCKYILTINKAWLCIMVYVATLTAMIYYQMDIPYVTLGIHLNISQIPIFLLLSICGSIGIIGCCKSVGSVRIMTFLGKNSLIIYALHIAIARLLMKGLSQIDAIGPWIALFLIWCFTLIISGLIALLIQKSFLKVIIGKF